MTKEQWPTVKLGTLLSPVGVAERITQPEDETFVTLKLHGGGAVPRNIGAGKTPKPFIGFRIRTNQFIYSRIDARNGAFAIVPKALDGAVVSKDFPVFSIGELVESRYLAYFCTTPSFEKLVQVKSSGATNRQRIKEDLFLSLEIPLPPLEEQRRIARKLSLNQSTILRIQKSIEMLENFRVQSAVRMFESARQTLLLGDFAIPLEGPACQPNPLSRERIAEFF